MAYSRPCSAYVADHSLPCEIIPESPLHAVDPLISSFRQMVCLRSLHQLSLIERSWTSVSWSILGITDLFLSPVSMFQSIGSIEPQPDIFRLNWETVRSSNLEHRIEISNSKETQVNVYLQHDSLYWAPAHLQSAVVVKLLLIEAQASWLHRVAEHQWTFEFDQCDVVSIVPSRIIGMFVEGCDLFVLIPVVNFGQVIL